MPARLPESAAVFTEAVASLRAVRLPAPVSVQEVPAPTRIAPFALALTAEVDGDDVLGSGRFVLLHDPSGQDSWEGDLRIVTYLRADLEPDLGEDPMLSDIGWSWLTEQMDPLPHHALGGTVTRVLSRSHGTLSDRPPTVEIEIRASWTPDTPDIGAHLETWAAVLCTVAGIPPLPEGVHALQRTLH